MSLPPVFLFTRSTNAGGKLCSCPKSIPIFFITVLLSFRAKPKAKSRNLEFQTSARDVPTSLDTTTNQSGRGLSLTPGYEPGELREKRNEAVLTPLSRGAV